LDENIDYVAILVNSPPQIPSLPLDRHEQFVQVPRVAQATLPSPERPGIFGTELLTPLPDGFVADDDPTLGQKILNISEAQAEAVVEPDGLTDNFRGEPVSAIAGLVGCHRPSLPVIAST
jgi:hypothetical protein